jgi:hypothetical protein
MTSGLRWWIAAAALGALALVPARPSHAQWSMSGEFLYWQPTLRTFVVVEEANDAAALDRPLGKQDGPEHGYVPGFRISAGWNPLRATYTYLRSTARFSRACGPGVASDCLLSTLSNPDLIATGYGDDEIDVVSARSKLSLDMIDLDLRLLLATTENLSTHWSIGFRYARLAHRLHVTYTDLPADVDEVKVDATNNMYGIRVGLEGRYQLPSLPQLGLEGKLGISLLSGNSEALLRETACEPALVPNCLGVKASAQKQNVVPAIEAAIKLMWTPVKNLDLWVGWDFLAFLGVLTTTEIVDATQDGRSIDMDRNMGFLGLTGGLRWRF